MSEKADYLIIGKIVKPFGIKGELKIIPITDRLDRFKKLNVIFLKDQCSFKKKEVEGTKVCKDYVLLKLKNIDSIDDAESLRNEILYVDRNNAAEIDEGSYYYYDLVGCKVVTTDQELIGELVDIQNTGSSDIYLIRSAKDKKREYLIPAVSDVIKKIDLNEKRIIIEVLDGLLDQ